MIENRKHHRLNAVGNGDVTPDRVISQPDRVQIGGGWRGFFELGAVRVELQSVPTIYVRLKTDPTVQLALGSKP